MCKLFCTDQPFFLSVDLWPEEGDFPENVHRVVYVTVLVPSPRSLLLFGVELGPSSKQS